MARNNANPGAKERQQVILNAALPLRLAGASYRTIAEQLTKSGVLGEGQVVSPSHVYSLIKRSLTRLVKENQLKTEQLRALELSRLDALLLGVWSTALKGHLGAVQTALQIHHARMRMLPGVADIPLGEVEGQQVLEITYERATIKQIGEGGGHPIIDVTGNGHSALPAPQSATDQGPSGEA